jgi:hypothetical protein
MYRAPGLKTQANLLADTLKADFGIVEASRHKVLDMTARMNGFHSWRHAAALGNESDAAVSNQPFVPVPEWVRSLSIIDCGWFQSHPTKERMEMYRSLAYAGFSPRVKAQRELIEFSRVIAPNAYQAIIPEEPLDAEDSRQTFGVVTTDYIDGDFFSAGNVFAANWPSALRAALLEVESQRVTAQGHPDAWIEPQGENLAYVRF